MTSSLCTSCSLTLFASLYNRSDLGQFQLFQQAKHGVVPMYALHVAPPTCRLQGVKFFQGSSHPESPVRSWSRMSWNCTDIFSGHMFAPGIRRGSHSESIPAYWTQDPYNLSTRKTTLCEHDVLLKGPSRKSEWTTMHIHCFQDDWRSALKTFTGFRMHEQGEALTTSCATALRRLPIATREHHYQNKSI